MILLLNCDEWCGIEFENWVLFNFEAMDEEKSLQQVQTIQKSCSIHRPDGESSKFLKHVFIGDGTSQPTVGILSMDKRYK